MHIEMCLIKFRTSQEMSRLPHVTIKVPVKLGAKYHLVHFVLPCVSAYQEVGRYLIMGFR